MVTNTPPFCLKRTPHLELSLHGRFWFLSCWARPDLVRATANRAWVSGILPWTTCDRSSGPPKFIPSENSANSNNLYAVTALEWTSSKSAKAAWSHTVFFAKLVHLRYDRRQAILTMDHLVVSLELEIDRVDVGEDDPESSRKRIGKECPVLGNWTCMGYWDEVRKRGSGSETLERKRGGITSSCHLFPKEFHYPKSLTAIFHREFHFGRSRLSGEMLVRDSGVLGTFQGKIRNFISNWNCWIWTTPTTSSHTLLGPGNSPHRTCCGQTPT